MKKLMRKVSHKDKDKEKDKKEKSEKHKDKKKHKHDKEASTSGAGKYTALSETTVTTKTSSSSIPGDKETKTVTTTTHTSSGPSGGKSTTVIEKKETGADGVTTITKESHDKSHKAPEKEDKKVKAPEKEKTGAAGETTVTKESHDKSHKVPEKEDKKVKAPEKEKTGADGVTTVTKESHDKSHKVPEKEVKKVKVPEKEEKKVLPTEKITSTKITTSFSSPAASEPKHASHMTVTTNKVVGGDEGKKVETVTKSVSHNDGTTVKTTETKSSYGPAVEDPSSPVRSVNGKVFLPGWNDKNEKYEVKEQMAVPSIAVARQSANLPKWMKEVKEDKKPKGKAVILEPDDPSLTFEVKRKETPVTVQGSTVVETVESVHTESSPDIDFSRLQEEAPRHTTTKQITTSKTVGNGEGTVTTTTKETSDDKGKKTKMETKTSGKIKEPDREVAISHTRQTDPLPSWLVEVKEPAKRNVAIDHSIKDPTFEFEVKRKETKPKPKGSEVVEEIHPIVEDIRDPFIFLDELEGGPARKQESRRQVQTHVEPEELFDFKVTTSKPKERAYKGSPVKEGFVQSVTTESSPDIDFTRLESQTPDRGEPSRYSKITAKNDVTSGKGNQGVDKNYNVVKQPQKTEEEEPEWDEFAEEIIIVNKKRKVRIPKNFVAYEKPRRHADPVVWKSLESLVEPPKQPKTKPVRRGYGMVSERVNESKSDKKVELPDLNRLAQ